MKKAVYLSCILFLLSCENSLEERSFISCDISISDKFYFISEENSIDRSRPMAVICSNKDSVFWFDVFTTSGFDLDDYSALDRPINIHNRIDSAVYFPNQKLDSVCYSPICVQLETTFKVAGKSLLGTKEINADKRLSSVHSNCQHMDEGVLYELETVDGKRYSIYDITLYKSCDYLSRDIFLYKGSKLINEEHH